MNEFDRDLYIDNLVFQGSSDNANWDDIHSVGTEIHEGWNAIELANPVSYKHYRFYAAEHSACEVGEVELLGWTVHDSSADSITLDVLLDDVSVGASVTYEASSTPTVTGISPIQITVLGGDSITFTGTDFSNDVNDIHIEIDGIDCDVTSASTTSVTCTSGERPGTVAPSIVFRVDGAGQAALLGNEVYYVNKWSSTETWGGELPPLEGESIHIPVGLNLLMDIDETPKLNLILVEGTLIFAPDADADHQRTLHAHIIFINGGHLIAGTEDEPYTSKLDIVLYGEKYGPTLPTFGNKCIANHGGILDIHGNEVTSWTELAVSAEIGDTSITLNSAVDWQVGDQIMLVPTDYVYNEDEVFTIGSITSGNNPVITFADVKDKIRYRHFAETETFGTWEMPMHGEVALLTRNIKIRGSYEDSVEAEYGAQIITHHDSGLDDSSITRLSYVQMYHVGQAFLLGRYPIHFHRLGNAHASYVNGCAIHNTFNRAIVVHQTNYVTFKNNVAYDVLGHTIFIEDGVEEHNYFEGNLAVKCKRSWSLLMTDQMAACFFITNANNIFRGNRAIASERMGFWFDLKDTATGPNMEANICPVGVQLGEFSDNHVHSNGMYGLRLFDQFNPRTYPCLGLSYDASQEDDDPYWQNPPIAAEFEALIGWKNGRSCAITKDTGDIRFNNFKCIDNAKSQIEFSLSGHTRWGTAQVSGGVMIGYSAGNSDTAPLDLEFGVSDPETAKGVTASRKEFFEINDVTFYNFDKEGQSAIYTCSQCFFALNEEHARTTRTSGLIFDDASVLYRLAFQTPFRDIVEDTDGTLTDLDPWTTVTAYMKHNDVDECVQNDSRLVDALICSPDVQVRRIAFYGHTPASLFLGQEIKIVLWDDDIIDPLRDDQDAYDAYVDDDDNYTALKFDENGAPGMAHHAAFVTGHKYKISFGALGLDFEEMRVQIEDVWRDDDLNIYLVHNHTDTRVAINVTAAEADAWGGLATIGQIDNETLFFDESQWLMGYNVHYPNTYTDDDNKYARELHLLINGKTDTKDLFIAGQRCWDTCLDLLDNNQIPDETINWSEETSWDADTDFTLPTAGMDVTIKADWNMIYDIPPEDAVRLGTLTILGRLTFTQDFDAELIAEKIVLNRGELYIGTEDEPYPADLQATITLTGEKNDEHFVISNTFDAGNKGIYNLGKLVLVGETGSHSMTRLAVEAEVGDTSIFVDDVGDWEAGDKIGIAPTFMDPDAGDTFTIEEVNSITGELVFADGYELLWRHYGAATSAFSDTQGTDVRAEVVKLSRNILVRGEDTESWGGQILTTDAIDDDGIELSGYLYLDGVQFYNMSQMDTEKAAVRIEYKVFEENWSTIKNCAFEHGNGWGLVVRDSQQLIIENNIVWSFACLGIRIIQSDYITIDGNFVGMIRERDFVAGMLLDTRAAYLIGGGTGEGQVNAVTVTNNIAAGAVYAGFIVAGYACADGSGAMGENNRAHSIDGEGWIAFSERSNAAEQACFQASNF